MTKAALRSPRADDLYETDFFLWTQLQADRLRNRRFDEPDLERLSDGFLPKQPDLSDQT